MRNVSVGMQRRWRRDRRRRGGDKVGAGIGRERVGEEVEAGSGEKGWERRWRRDRRRQGRGGDRERKGGRGGEGEIGGGEAGTR